MFYKTNVDICSTKSMWNFLKNHCTYYTMNSCSRSKSIANNVKLYNLKLEGDWTVVMKYLFDETDAGCLQTYIDDEIREFEEEYPWTKVFFNGRSGGYLVLGTKLNGSVLPDCVADYNTYEEFKEDIKDWSGARVSDFNRELREAVEIVREFDRLCDRLRDLVNEYSKKSFDTDKLEQALEWFDNEYGDDLISLGLKGPSMYNDGDNNVVDLNDIASYSAFMHCFLDCLGEDKNRVFRLGKLLWLKEA